MKWFTGLLSIVAATFALSAAQAVELRDPAKYFFEETLGELGEDLNEAKKNGKKGVMLFFEQDECPFCHRMKTTILNHRDVQEYLLKRFLVLSIDIESTEELTDFQGNHTNKKEFFNKIARNRGATPVFAFFDMNGKLVVRYTGPVTDKQEMKWLGEYASEGIYTQMTFSKYKREKRRNAQP